MKILSLIFALMLTLFIIDQTSDYRFSAKLQSRKTSEITPSDSPNALTIQGGTGIGIFKDIQVPINEELQSRGDGTITKTEFDDHAGFPLSLAIRYSSIFGSFRWTNGGELLSISATSGPVDTQSSSYSRISLSSDFDYLFGLGSMIGFIGSKIEARRSSFDNLSNGHQVNAGLISIRAGIEEYLGYKIQGYAGFAPISEFRYHSSRNFVGNKMKSSRTKMSELGIASSFKIYKDAWFDLGLEQEYLLIKIDDVSEYDSFGLAVTPTNLPNRVYDFETTILKVGLHKSF